VSASPEPPRYFLPMVIHTYDEIRYMKYETTKSQTVMKDTRGTLVENCGILWE